MVREAELKPARLAALDLKSNRPHFAVFVFGKSLRAMADLIVVDSRMRSRAASVLRASLAGDEVGQAGARNHARDLAWSAGP